MSLRWNNQTRNSKDAGDLKTSQENSCGICGVSGVPLVLDHDHQTRMVRGWLCRPCNAWLGHHLDKYSKKYLQAALAYLKEPPIKFLKNHPWLTERRLKCSKCKLEKPYAEFYKYRRGGTVRFSGYCKPCQAEYVTSRKVVKSSLSSSVSKPKSL